MYIFLVRDIHRPVLNARLNIILKDVSVLWRRKNLRKKCEKTRGLAAVAGVKNLRSSYTEEIRNLINPHFSFTRGRLRTPTGDFYIPSWQNATTLQVHPACSWIPGGRGAYQPPTHRRAVRHSARQWAHHRRYEDGAGYSSVHYLTMVINVYFFSPRHSQACSELYIPCSWSHLQVPILCCSCLCFHFRTLNCSWSFRSLTKGPIWCLPMWLLSRQEFLNFQGAQESIPPAYVEWRARTTTLLYYSVPSHHRLF